ncbi:MAG: hypothetical protein BWZ07_02912 [Alphaproteobacteria bacterium ADurb.BinA280]|nr:MAG: hypothetical protein BWZ07_02912 [Alphaproteobacteria bacterium ADurb.BinA280]
MLLRKSSELAEMPEFSARIPPAKYSAELDTTRRWVRSNANPDRIELSRMEIPPPPVAILNVTPPVLASSPPNQSISQSTKAMPPPNSLARLLPINTSPPSH